MGPIQDYANLRAERSLAAFDVPHRFVLSYILELPFGRGKRFFADAGAANKLASGWTVSGITTFASGSPLGITSSALNYISTLFGAGTIRPNVVPGCDKSAGGSILDHVFAYLTRSPPHCVYRNRLAEVPCSTITVKTSPFHSQSRWPLLSRFLDLLGVLRGSATTSFNTDSLNQTI